MKLRSISRSFGIVLLVTLVLILIGCGSSDEATPEPQSSGPPNSPAQKAILEDTPAPAQPQSSSTSQPTPAVQATSRDSNQRGPSSLRDQIVGTWVEAQGSRLLAFSPDGRFLALDEILGTYEAISDHNIRLTFFSREFEPTIITILEISDEEFAVSGESFGASETYYRVKGPSNLAQDVVGYWRVDDTALDPNASPKPEIWFPSMKFEANGEFMSPFADGKSYEVFNDSMILVHDPSYDPILFKDIGDDAATVRFDFYNPTVTLKRLEEDRAAANYLVGLWKLENSGDLIEFTRDGRAIWWGTEWSYSVFEDGTVLMSEPLGRRSSSKLVIESDDLARMEFESFDFSNLKFQTSGGFTLTRLK